MNQERPTEAYPLTWPSGWKRTSFRHSSPFVRTSTRERPSIAYAGDEVMRELELMNARNIIISSNLQVRADGLPYSKQPNLLKDPGIAVYFTRKDKQQVLACDTFDRAGCNLWAIARTVNALRQMERDGCSEMLERAFTGFRALPEKGSMANWWVTLGVAHNSTYEDVRRAYLALVKKHHPDKGGSAERFHEIQRAWEAAQKAMGVEA